MCKSCSGRESRTPRETDLVFKVGDKRALWTIISDTFATKGGHRKWLCRCICGTERYISGSRLHTGRDLRSCGCSSLPKLKYQQVLKARKKEVKKCPQCGTDFPAWKKHKDGRVVPNRSVFCSCSCNIAFQAGHSSFFNLKRKKYSFKDQSQSWRSPVLIIFNEEKTKVEWLQDKRVGSGVTKNVFDARRRRGGWTLERALTTPVIPRKPYLKGKQLSAFANSLIQQINTSIGA